MQSHDIAAVLDTLSGAHKLQFGAPFSVASKRLLDCQYGQLYKKPSPPKSTRTRLQGSKKKGCKAHIEITELTLYPNYSITSQITPTTSQKQARKLKEGLMQSLQQALEAGKIQARSHKCTM